MSMNAGRIVTALVGAELTTEQCEHNRYCPRGNVVTIAHDLGSGGRVIARSLAERLGIECYDREILDAIVAAVPEDEALMQRLDQHVASAWAEFLHQVLAGKSALNEYRRHLIGVVLAIARKSGVIVGRGAHLILSHHKVFRVRVVGSPEACAQRLLEQGQGGPATRMTWEHAMERVVQARQQDTQFIRQQFNKDYSDAVLFDLVVSTDHIPVEAAPDVILAAMRAAGFEVDKRPAVAIRPAWSQTPAVLSAF